MTKTTRKLLFLLSGMLKTLLMAAQADTVIMLEMSFQPATLKINTGTTVTWINKTKQDHTSTSGTNCSKDGKWNSGYVSEDQSFSFTFDSAGTYPYYCIPHCLTGMKGVVVVKAKENAMDAQLKKKESNEQTENIKSVSNSTGFKSLDVINAVTATTLDKGILDFTIYHRFDDLSGSKGGPQTFYGLDNVRDLRFAFAYGLLKNITLGIGRSKGDAFNAPYQLIKNLYDGSIKINICSQETTNKKFPFSVAVYANTVYSAMKNQDILGAESNFQHFTDRFSHSCEVIVAHSFPKYLSLQIMPVYLRRNWVNTYPGVSMDELDLFALGSGAKWSFTNRVAILAEYFYVFSAYRQNNKEIFSNPLALGVEINTGGHVFHINLSNSTGIIPNTFIPYTTSSWIKNGFRLGFSISRKFTLNKNQNKK